MRHRPESWGWALGLIALGAFALRLYAINFGLPGLYDPDELMFELGAIRMLSHATLNPGWFGHPATTTMYGLALVNVSVFGVGHLAGWYPTLKSFGEAVYSNPGVIVLPGRVLMALFGAGTVWQTGQLGRELFDRRAGWVAALLVALSPVCVAWSQVVRSDIMGSFFVMLALRAMLRVERRPNWRTDMAAAGWMGAAIATKWPMGLAAIGMGIMVLRAAWPDLRSGTPILRLARFGAMMVGFTLLVSPYLLLAYPVVVRDLHGEAQLHHLGATGGTPLQNLVWYLRGPFVDGLGALGLALAGGGVLLALRGADRRAAWLLGPVMLGMGVVICFQHMVWERWALPFLPFLAILAGRLVVRLFDGFQRWWGAGRLAGSAMGLVLVAMLLPLLWQDLAQARARMHDTRAQASAWAVAHVPQRSTIMIEHFGFDLYPQPWPVLFPLGDAGCIDIRALLQGKVSWGVIDAVRGSRANIDYGTMGAARAASCQVDYAIITQFDRYAAEKNSFPGEYAAYRQLLARGKVVASFFPHPGVSAGPVVRIVRFERPVAGEAAGDKVGKVPGSPENRTN